MYINRRVEVNLLSVLNPKSKVWIGFEPMLEDYKSTVLNQTILSDQNKRREWDLNPRALADKRFSRPPRYDHFDTSPNNRLFSDIDYISKKGF